VAYWKCQLEELVTVKEGKGEAWTAFLNKVAAYPPRPRRVSDASNSIKTLQKEVNALTSAVQGLLKSPIPATSGTATPATS
jgi:hypothetical protein